MTSRALGEKPCGFDNGTKHGKIRHLRFTWGKKALKILFFGSKESQNQRLCRPPNDLGGKQALKDMSYTVESSRSWSAEIFSTNTARYHTRSVPAMDFFSFQILAWLFLFSSFSICWGYDPIHWVSVCGINMFFTCNWIFLSFCQGNICNNKVINKWC